MSKPNALVVDDESDIRELLEITLTRMGITTLGAADLAEARQAISSRKFDLCLTDMRLPDGSGKEVIAHIQTTSPNTPVAVITAYGNMEDAVESLKAGAFDFVSKPVDLKVLRELVNSALSLPDTPVTNHEHHLLIGDSPAIADIKEKITKLARSQAPVYLSGESGTGKELVANLIHSEGPRADQPFIPVNCGAIPSELMESEFFGHIKGSFTGAHADKKGLFEAANKGTLFLDEVGDLPLTMQVKLLRVLQERRVRPIGKSEENAIDVRIICATHRNLADLVNEGSFRQDLYYRLNVVQLELPPLRERPEDIPALTDFMLEKLRDRHSMDTSPTLTKEAVAALGHYNFPGNIRELENILERAMTLCGNHSIDVEDLDIKGPMDASSASTSSSLEEQVEEMERDAIIAALEKAKYNKTRAAEILGMSFRSLRYRLKKFGIQ